MGQVQENILLLIVTRLHEGENWSTSGLKNSLTKEAMEVNFV